MSPFFFIFSTVLRYKLGPPNSNMANLKFHLIQTLAQTSVNFPIFSMLNWMVNLNVVSLKFHVSQTFHHTFKSNFKVTVNRTFGPS